MFKAVLSVLLNWLFSFVLGKKSERERNLENTVNGYKEGEKIDAQPDLPTSGDNNIYDWFKRVSRKK